MNEISRLRWQCRRGMKELDLLLEDYLNTAYPAAGAAEQHAFAALLELPDPVLLAYVIGREQPDTEDARRVVAVLRRAPRT